jgi:hypothetical protein
VNRYPGIFMAATNLMGRIDLADDAAAGEGTGSA